VDPNARSIDSDDLAYWLLFFLESHGATITVMPNHHVHVDLDTMPGLTAAVVARWAPVIANLLPEIGQILKRRAAGRESLTS
jgi:hypothetical protein